MSQHQFNSVPTLDMSLYNHGSAHERQAFARELCEICHQTGFFYLKNHDVPATLLREILYQSNAFFALPQHEKDKIDISLSPHCRGYGKYQAERTLGMPDQKETYDFGIERSALGIIEIPYQTLHGPNQWPAAMNNHFQQTILNYTQQMLDLGWKTMTAIAQGLNVSTDIFAQHFHPHSADAFAMLRLLHYPPANLEQNGFGVGPHVDAGCLVFLLQDDVGGLQVQNHAGEWIDAPPVKDSFIVNLGEMLQLFTDYHFIATPHRVLNHRSKHRISAPFFFEPNLSATIRPMHLAASYPRHYSANIKGQNQAVSYGEHMLSIYKRSFQYAS